MKVPGMSILENHPLGELTTFKIGGPARYFTEVASEQEIIGALAFAKDRSLDIFTLGGGSNLLVSDEGFPGLVIHNKMKGIESRLDGDSVIVTAGAGHGWDAFAEFCARNNWQGSECLSGIPGTIGAAPVQNIGAYGQSAESITEEVRAMDLRTAAQVVLANKECGFGYRRSIFNTTAAGQYIITAVTFRLAASGSPRITHHDLKKRFSASTVVTAAQVRDAVLDIRNSKGLLVLEGYHNLNSAGSFFKNPVVSRDLFEQIEKTVLDAGGCENWHWPQASGDVKISAACLIQTAGFTRGYRKGNVGISPHHTLAVVNHGNATACEVIDFARLVQDRVRETFSITLEPEVQLIGKLPPLL